MSKKRRILVTNDDGIDAPGLAVLTEALEKLGSKIEIWVVAPQVEQSGSSQSITMNVPVSVRQDAERCYAVSCTPSDCVVVGMQHIMKNSPPDFIISGVNAGINIGYDINLSGTLGAAFTGLMYGIPSIAISLKRGKTNKMHWDTAAEILPCLLSSLLAKGWKKNYCVSINIPDLPAEKVRGSRWTQPAHGLIPPFDIKPDKDLRHREHFWIHPCHRPGESAALNSDAAALEKGFVSISVLALPRVCDIPAHAPPPLFKSPAPK